MYDAANCHTPCRDNDDKYYGIQHDLKKVFEPHVDISAIYMWPQHDAKVQATKTWFDMGIFQVDGRASTCGYLVDKTPCYTLFGTGASKAMLNKKFYDEHPILHHYPKYPINVQLIQVANDQFIPVKEAIKFLISFGGHIFEIIAYLLPFSTAFDFISGMKNMTEIEGKSNYSKLEFKFRKRPTGIIPTKDIHLPIGKTTAIDCEMVRKPPDLSDGIPRGLIDLEINLEIVFMIDHMIELEMVEMILDKSPTGIVNIVIKMVTLGNIVGRCKPILRKPESLKR